MASNGSVLHALSVATGQDQWSFDAGASYGSDLSTAPAVLRDGLILWPGPHDRVFALSPRGRLRWTIQLSGPALTPAVDPARRLLVLADASGGLRAYRLAPGGAAPVRLWSHTLAAASFGNPALAGNDTTFQTAGDSLYAVSPAGGVLWRVKTSSQVEVSAAVAEDGTVVFGSGDQREYGVSPDGRLRWRGTIGNYTDGTLLIGGDDGVLRAIRRSGRAAPRSRARGRPNATGCPRSCDGRAAYRLVIAYR